jgi:uncharacterized membrane protein HdeD (DUF308 family)
MNDSLLHSWWMPAARGAVAIAFGVLALLWPNLTLLGLVALFSAYALITGAISIAAAIRNRKRDDQWWLMLIIGLAGVIAGIVALIHPEMTALVLVLIVAANALVTGVLDIALAIRLRKSIRDEWLYVLNGIASILFGVVAFLFPTAGALAIVWMISLYAVVTGALLIAAAFRLRAGTAPAAGTPERRVTPDRRAAQMPVHP